MSATWQTCKNILIIRPDNMGDLVMSGPAIRALKQSFNARITVLTSSMAAGIAEFMNEIDEVITFDFPWVKNDSPEKVAAFTELIEQIRICNFDAAVIFTVYSQNPMPSIMLAYLAGIPKRLAYCRENPYELLTDWVPDKEPYTLIKHQVQRDLDLVAYVGAYTPNDDLILKVNSQLWPTIQSKLALAGFDRAKKWLILHAGVSEAKRRFKKDVWIETAKQLINQSGYQLVLTGSASEKQLTDELKMVIGESAISAGGLFNLEELITLISRAPVLLSVNTGTVHIAAAVNTPTIVLYALTNPQHTPWKTPCRVLPYRVAGNLHSKNEVIKFVNNLYKGDVDSPDAGEIINAVQQLLTDPQAYANRQLCLIELMQQRLSLI